MPWIVTIKNADTSEKKKGDLVGVYEDSHAFSDEEHNIFNISKITGFTREEIVNWLQSNMPEIKRIYRLSVANQWTDEKPEEKKLWDDNGVWRFLKVLPKYGWNFGSFTAADVAFMADPSVINVDKITLWLNKIEFRFTNLPENQAALNG